MISTNLISRCWLLFTLFLSLIAGAAEPLPVKQAFVPHLSGSAGQYSIRIDFPPHYYLYVDRTTLSSDGTPLTYSATPHTTKSDPYFGDVNVWTTPPTLTVNSDSRLESITLRTQGCEDGVICYPPTTWTLPVPTTDDVPATPLGNLFQSANRNAPDVLQNRAVISSSEDDILPAEAAFITETSPDNAHDIILTLPAGYYAYKDSITFHHNDNDLSAQTTFPPSLSHADPFRGTQDIYRNQVTFTLPKLDHYPANITMTLQGCAEDRICYPPQTRTLQLNNNGDSPIVSTPQKTTIAPPDTTNHINTDDNGDNGDNGDIAQQLVANYWTTLPLIFLLGIALSFTACIYPLIPIVTSLVVGKNSTTARSYGLISVYVLFMGIAMAVLGAIFGLFEINLQVILQTPWITVLVALFFAVLALSMFDVFTLQAPGWLQKHIDKLNRRQQSGSYIGAAVMGALSVLVVSPCATPVLTALLLFSAQTTALKGALALFLFGVGSGLPLLLFAGALRRFMPRAGTWMNIVKKGFAFALLAIAVWLVTRILPVGWALLTWAAYAVLFASYIFPLTRSDSHNQTRIRFALAVAALIIALTLTQHAASTLLEDTQHNSSATSVPTPADRFMLLNDSSSIAAAIADSDRPVILDFYADWCIACKVWERDIWHNPAFNAALADYTLIKVDVTNFSDAHQALFRTLNLVGPPAVLIYPAHGTLSAPQTRIIGEISTDAFRTQLNANLAAK